MNGSSSETPKSPEIEKKPLRIIYIEDQEVLRNFIKEEFKKFSKDVSIISSFSKAEEAMEYLMKLGNESPGLPDAIVTDNDLGLGTITGIQFAKNLKQHGFEIPVVLLTSNAPDYKYVSEKELKGMGLTKVVGKMTEIRDLVGMIKQVKLQ